MNLRFCDAGQWKQLVFLLEASMHASRCLDRGCTCVSPQHATVSARDELHRMAPICLQPKAFNLRPKCMLHSCVLLSVQGCMRRSSPLCTFAYISHEQTRHSTAHSACFCCSLPFNQPVFMSDSHLTYSMSVSLRLQSRACKSLHS